MKVTAGLAAFFITSLSLGYIASEGLKPLRSRQLLFQRNSESIPIPQAIPEQNAVIKDEAKEVQKEKEQ